MHVESSTILNRTRRTLQAELQKKKKDDISGKCGAATYYQNLCRQCHLANKNCGIALNANGGGVKVLFKLISN